MHTLRSNFVNYALAAGFSLLLSNSTLLIADETQAPQYSCPSGQCGLPNNQPNPNGQYHCPQCQHRGPDYGYNPGWEAGIEVLPHHCPSCQNGHSNHPRFLPDSDTNSYDYYNYYESDCYPQ